MAPISPIHFGSVTFQMVPPPEDNESNTRHVNILIDTIHDDTTDVLVQTHYNQPPVCIGTIPTLLEVVQDEDGNETIDRFTWQKLVDGVKIPAEQATLPEAQLFSRNQAALHTAYDPERLEDGFMRKGMELPEKNAQFVYTA